MLYSFDVFDTLVARIYVRPTELFSHLGRDLLGRGAPPAMVDALARARIAAEARARSAARRRRADDVRFEEIYREFARDAVFGAYADEAARREIALEIASVVPIRAGVQAVEERRRSGSRVVFVTDMYLPSAVIVAILRQAGIDAEEGDVYVSGSVGLSKYRGRLYDHVASKEQVDPRDCLHVGDRPKPDVRRARQHGWQAGLFRASQPNRFETASAAGSVGARAAGISRASRLRCLSGSAEVAAMVADVAGPLVCAFVAELLRDASSRGIDTLYFVSRDGQVLLRAARALQARGAGAGIELRYMHGSRQAWFLPSVIEGSAAEIDWALLPGMAMTPASALRRLELRTDAVVQALGRLGLDEADIDRPLPGARRAAFLDLLVAPPIRDLLLARAHARRELMVLYLRQQGFADPGRRSALVDVGWELRAQKALRSVLRAAGMNRDLRGYYLGVAASHVPLEGAGPARAFIGASGAAVDALLRADWFFRHEFVQLVEHAFVAADHPSVTGYRLDGEQVVPTFANEAVHPRRVEFVRSLHQEISAYATLAGERLDGLLDTPEFRSWVADNLQAYCSRPSAGEARAVGWLATNAEQGHDPSRSARLAAPMTLGDLWRMARHEIGGAEERFHSPSFSWTAGSLALSPRHVRAAHAGLRWAKGLARPRRSQ